MVRHGFIALHLIATLLPPAAAAAVCQVSLLVVVMVATAMVRLQYGRLIWPLDLRFIHELPTKKFISTWHNGVTLSRHASLVQLIMLQSVHVLHILLLT